MDKLQKEINYIIKAHEKKDKKRGRAIRIFDKKTSYYVHPIWCAMTILQEPNLSEELRKNGSIVLLYHDVLEDTTAKIPKRLKPFIKKLILEMTFESPNEAREKIWERSKEARLLKLYDSVNNLLDNNWISKEKRKIRVKHIKKLIKDVKKNFGNLNIIKIAESVIK